MPWSSSAALERQAPAGCSGWALAGPARHARRCPQRARPVTASSKKANGDERAKPSYKANGDDTSIWHDRAFPLYLQKQPGSDEGNCASWEEVLASGRNRAALPPSAAGSSIWKVIRSEAEADVAAEPLLSSFLYASILSHDSFERSLAFVLANRLADATLMSTELFEVFYSILRSHPTISGAGLEDLCAVRERDPACLSYSQALLYFKGFHAIQVHRIAHELWQQGRHVLACALQSRMSEVFAVDIHPGARVGKGLLLDHGTGVVIGETATIGDNVSIMQNVTLGGTGKEHGDRHPKISDNVLIGASATILGNISIGKGAQVAAGSLVLKTVPPHTMVAGSPSREVGTISGNPAQKMEQWNRASQDLLRSNLERDPFAVAPALPGPQQQRQQQGEQAVKAKAAPVELSPRPVRQGAPPRVDEPVDAVTSDKDAKKKWPKAQGAEDPDYFI